MKHNVGETSTVSRETLDRLHVYERLLAKWNATINLVGPSASESVWDRHFADSLQIAPLLPAGVVTAIDLGSGGGFPGLVLAIATNIHFDLIEADRRKAAFLGEVIAATVASATVHPMRIESATLPAADIVTARGLAPLDELLLLGARFLKPGGMAIFQKGARAEEEIARASVRWRMNIQRHRSATDMTGVILQLTEIARADA